MKSNSIWFQLENYPTYEVSRIGTVRHKLSQKLLKQSVNSYGTHRVCLNKKTIPVYRLVAKSFLPNPNKYHWIKLQMVISNNVASNLEWVEKQPYK